MRTASPEGETPIVQSCGWSARYKAHTSGRRRPRSGTWMPAPQRPRAHLCGCRGGQRERGRGDELQSPVPRRLIVARVHERGAEEPVRPFLREVSVLAEQDRDRRESHLCLCEAFHDHRWLNVLKLEQCRVSILDHHCGTRQRGEIGEQVAQLAGRERRDEIGDGLALDGRDDRSVDLDAVVAGAQCTAHRRALLLGEPPGVSLMTVDDDHERLARRPPGRQPHVRPGLACGPRALPEHDLATAGLGEHELGPVFACAGQHEVDRGSAPPALTHRYAFEHFRVRRPRFGRVAVDLCRARP